MSESVEQQARRLLWVFPAWLRAERGEEALGLVLDLVPAAATRLPLRSRWDLVRAGLHTRRRAIPPWSVWCEVLAADPRNNRGLIPIAWRPWLVHWLRQPRWRLRFGAMWLVAALLVFAAIGPVLIAARQSVSIDPAVAIYPLVFAVLKARASGPKWRWVVAVRNGLEPEGLRPFPPGTTAVGTTAPVLADRPARPLLVAGLVWSLAVAAGAAAVAATTAPGGGALHGSVQRAVTILAVVVGGGVAFAFGRRIDRLVSEAPVVRPSAPDPAAYVARPVWHRRAQLMGVVAYAVAWAVASLLVVAGGLIGLFTALLGAGAWAWALFRVLRRERTMGRRLGLWEVAPTFGPRPLLLVREGVVDRPVPAWMAPSGRDRLA